MFPADAYIIRLATDSRRRHGLAASPPSTPPAR